jgi:PleD family two-component response regulator
LKAIKEERPDLILLDIVMPKMNGFEVMEEMGKDKELSKIPVIVVSNSGQPVELDRAQKLGAKDWLIKTEFDPQEVIDKVIRQIGK